MRTFTAPKLPKWPFFLGDALLAGAAVYLFYVRGAAGGWESLACLAFVALGAVLGVLPYILEHRAVVRFAEAEGLATAVTQIKRVEQLAAQIGYATNQWQIVRESADKTTVAAKEIAQGMAAEVKAFNEFLERANDSEKATLRLEVDKARRGEGEWLQVLVRMLDHVYALHQAGLRSGQPNVIRQLGQFQDACRDVGRRVGLVPFVAAAGEPFNAQRHQLADDGDPKAAEGAAVEETLVTGYTFQGRLLRPALVRLHSRNGAETAPAAQAPSPEETADQDQLPLPS